MPKDVFISHSSLDRELATSVCQCLERDGLGCWIAPRDITPGSSWGGSIVQALDECPVMVLLLTERANASRHVVKEVERADSKAARIVTFRAEPVTLNPSLEYFLSAEHWLDAVSRPIEPHLRELVRAVTSVRGSRRAPDAVTLAPRAQAPRSSRRELVSEFDELAPDDWDNRRVGRIGHFFRALFEDR
jgi:TIR domain-containing protein